jgi:hypothetical protein
MAAGSTVGNEPGGLVTRNGRGGRMRESEAGASYDPGDSWDLRGACAAERPGGKSAPESAEPTHKRLSFRVVPSIPTPEPPVPPLAAQFF